MFSLLASHPFRRLFLCSVCSLGFAAPPQFIPIQASESVKPLPVGPSLNRQDFFVRPEDRGASALISMLNAHFIPPKKPQPKNTQSSATRGDFLTCPGDAESFQVLASPQDYGLSTSDRPALTVAIPNTSAQRLTLVFQDEADKFYERATFPLQGSSPNLQAFHLPDEAPALKPRKLYRWSIVVHCQDTIQPDDPIMTGWIEYKPLLVNGKTGNLAQWPLVKRLKWYGRQGYWYDMVEQIIR